MQLLVIIFEGILEERLIRDLKRLGVSAYTAWDVHGEGLGRQRQEWEVHTVRLETVIDAVLAAKAIDFLKTNYAPNYDVSVWTCEVTHHL